MKSQKKNHHEKNGERKILVRLKKNSLQKIPTQNQIRNYEESTIHLAAILWQKGVTVPSALLPQMEKTCL